MKTAQNIVDLMADAMPFKLNPDIVPYIIEAMKLYANQKLDEALSNQYEIEDEVPFKVVDSRFINSLKYKI